MIQQSELIMLSYSDALICYTQKDTVPIQLNSNERIIADVLVLMNYII